MKIEDLGNRLRGRRTAAGRTIASVAADAGLSVPYIANLENGRGNPTLSAVSSLADALGARLVVELAEDGDEPPRQVSVSLPDTLVQFSRSQRFTAEAAWLSDVTQTPETVLRERLLQAMATMGALATRPLSEVDWHRLLDAAILITRGQAGPQSRP